MHRYRKDVIRTLYTNLLAASSRIPIIIIRHLCAYCCAACEGHASGEATAWDLREQAGVGAAAPADDDDVDDVYDDADDGDYVDAYSYCRF